MTDDGFNKGQEAIIERVAWRVGDKIVDRVVPLIDQKIKEHGLECPTTKKVSRAFWIVFGIGLGVGIGGGFTLGSILATIARMP